MNDGLIKALKKHEGYRKFPYKCTAGKITIGIGRNLDDVGISEAEAEILLSSDICKATLNISKIFLGFDGFSVNRQIALIDMMFNLGKSKFLGFKKMIMAIKNNDWEEAASQAMYSKWHSQVGNRAIEIESLLKNG